MADIAPSPPSSEYQSNPALLAAVCEFNYRPFRYAHESWLKQLPHGRLFDILRGSVRAENRLSLFLLDWLELRGQYYFDFDNLGKQLALLKPEELSTLVLYAGLAANAKTVQHTVLQNDVLRMRESIGEGAYRFALKRAPHLGPIPQCVTPDGLYADDFNDHSLVCGMKCLSIAFGSHGPAFTRRLLLKLPTAWRDQFYAVASSDEDQLNVTSLLSRVATELELA